MKERPGSIPDDEMAEILADLAQHPDNAWTHHRLAAAWRQRGELAQAEKAVRSAMALDPANHQHHGFLAELLLSLDRPEEAQQILQAALPLAPQSPWLLALQGKCHWNLGESAKAIAALEQAILARSESSSGLDFGPDGLLKVTFPAGGRDGDEGKVEQAPTLADLFVELATYLLLSGEETKAIDLCRQGLERLPDCRNLLLFLLQILIRHERWEEALPPAWRLVGLGADEALYHRFLGTVLRGLGRDEDAIEAYRQATRLNPGDADAWFELATVLSRHHRKPEAAAAYRNAGAADPSDGMIQYNLGCVLMHMGDFATAAGHLRKAIELSGPPETPACGLPQARGPDARFYHNLGLVEWSLDHLAEADDALTRAVAMAPGDAAMRRNLEKLTAQLRQPARLPDVFTATRPGSPRRSSCDAFLVLREPALVVGVADGAGDAPTSARRALAQFQRMLAETQSRGRCSPEVWAGFIPVLDAHGQGEPETTFLAGGIFGCEVIGVWAGDSRAYVVPVQGPIELLTTGTGKARLGSGQARAGTFSRTMHPGDLLLLMTDGAWTPFDNMKTLEALVRGHPATQRPSLAEAIVAAAEKAGHTDDKTVVIVSFSHSPGRHLA
jgi:tetratricopeptide (TPR) repeat protein